MNKILSRFILLFLSVGILQAMEERPTKRRKIIYNNQDNFYQLPDEIVLQILSRLASEKPKLNFEDFKSKFEGSLEEAISFVTKMQLVSKRFYMLINDENFTKNMINYWAEKYKINPINIAILWNSPGAIKYLENVLKNESDITTMDQDLGSTPLGYVVAHGRIKIIEMFLKKNLLTLSPSKIFITITFAIQNKKNLMVNFLFDHMNDTGNYENEFDKPLNKENYQMDLNSWLNTSALYGNIEAAEFFIKKGANSRNCIGSGKLLLSPLYHAAANNDYKMAELLINNGAIVTNEILVTINNYKQSLELIELLKRHYKPETKTTKNSNVKRKLFD